ncbi:DUF2155 domain-containing protein [Yoonia vestfoldensis]|jgi:hypothetical protein|uniref:DUF2155 domain-containing protein n=1 Tax=Yoonia vestfoldensis TaxID=245188 RepID=A0A1Y0EDI7_9RHOB|nr:DUF2155 domain-containing protein [Yoonia vestfoldensis]ARU01342.1 hypothetical protein LOKVESSMR4R_02031 [Yoonia vestfoldensis]
MRRLSAIAACLLLAAPAAGQQMLSGIGAEIRILDKLTGAVTDLALRNGQSDAFGALSVTLNDCRYPADHVASDGYAALMIHSRNQVTPVFAGWMLASSPALNALDHPRYDVWVLRCITSLDAGTAVENRAD